MDMSASIMGKGENNSSGALLWPPLVPLAPSSAHLASVDGVH